MKSSMAPQQVQMIKADPRIKTLSMLSIMYWVVCALMWVTALLRIFTGVGPIDAQGQFSFGLFMNTLVSPMIWTILAISYIFVVRAMKRFDQRRLAAAQGDPQWLATEQPFPDAQALSLPLTVRMRPRWRWFALLALSTITAFSLPVLVGFFAGMYGGNNGSGDPIQLGILLIVLGSMLAFVLLIVAIMCFVMYIKGREQITLTDYGIILAGAMPKTHSISWSEARLFAIINPYTFKRFKDRQPLMLELASEHDTVRWTWLRGASKKMSFVTPMLPADEYEQQMQKVLSVIAAKTGLSLYDLRKNR